MSKPVKLNPSSCFPVCPPRADTSLSWINWFEGRSASVGKALGIGTALVQRVVMEQPRPFDVDVADYGVQVDLAQPKQWKSVAQNRFGQQPSIEPRVFRASQEVSGTSKHA